MITLLSLSTCLCMLGMCAFGIPETPAYPTENLPLKKQQNPTHSEVTSKTTKAGACQHAAIKVLKTLGATGLLVGATSITRLLTHCSWLRSFSATVAALSGFILVSRILVLATSFGSSERLKKNFFKRQFSTMTLSFATMIPIFHFITHSSWTRSLGAAATSFAIISGILSIVQRLSSCQAREALPAPIPTTLTSQPTA